MDLGPAQHRGPAADHRRGHAQRGYEQALAGWFGAARAVAVNSGTSALHATLVALDVHAGDEVIVPATAPLPTAMPILTCGAVPVIVDTAPWSLALDLADVSAKLTPKTQAAITLPLWGYPADDAAAAPLLTAAGIPIIEDACQAHGTKIRGRYARHDSPLGASHPRPQAACDRRGRVHTRRR